MICKKALRIKEKIDKKEREMEKSKSDSYEEELFAKKYLICPKCGNTLEIRDYIKNEEDNPLGFVLNIRKIKCVKCSFNTIIEETIGIRGIRFSDIFRPIINEYKDKKNIYKALSR